MKKIGIVVTGVIAMLTTTMNVSALTKWNFSDWETTDEVNTRVGGSVSKIDDNENFINLKGASEEKEGMKYGPRNNKSKASLANGIKEEAYVSLKSSDYKNGDLFELTVDLAKDSSDVSDDNYANESVIMTQKVGEVFVLTSNNDPSFRYEIKEDGIYTYRWEYSIKDESTISSTFTLLKNGEKLTETSKDLTDNKGATLNDVVVRCRKCR